LSLSTAATGLVSVWTLAQHPFAAPLVAQSAESASLAVKRAMAEAIEPELIIAELNQALEAADIDKVGIYDDLAKDQQITIPTELSDRVADFQAAEAGMLNTASDCAACALDISQCQKLSHIASCAIPVEMTPIGDLNALRRAGVDWAAGDEVDRLEVGLAFVGLGATGLAIGTGGAAIPVKAGASLLRSARRMGALTPSMTNIALGMADIAISWDEVPDYVIGRVPLDEVVDTAKLASIGDLASDLERVRQNTSTAEVLTLMKHVDTAEDAKNPARLSDAAGPRTTHVIETLGKSRSFRLVHRLSDMALLTVSLLAALALQLLALTSGVLRRVLRPKRHRLR
jgi:hypothetical protein